MTEYVISYLLDGTLRPVGTVCPANPNPFLPQPAAAAQARGFSPQPLIGLPASFRTR